MDAKNEVLARKSAAVEPLPVVEEPAPANPLLTSPERFINRELSWLQFNRRVLEEASNDEPSAAGAAKVPVDLGQQPRRVLHGARRGPAGPGAPGHLTQQLAGRAHAGRTAFADLRCASSVLASTSRRAGAGCAGPAADDGIVLVDGGQVTKRPSSAWLEEYFLTHVFPVLTPLAVDPAHPFPFIPNLGFSLALELCACRTDGRMSTRSSACRTRSSASCDCLSSPRPARAA